MSSIKIQPEYLRPGDEVAIVSPSFFIDENKLVEAVAFLEKWGLKVRVGKYAAMRSGPFAGSDEERFSDLQEMTNDPSIKAVFCSRGGYGVSRIISRIDFSPLKKNPKWYIGFSDITVLHLWLNEVCGIVSVHGEMPLNYNNEAKSQRTFSTLKDSLFGKPCKIEWEGSRLREKGASGELTGGNLSMIYSLSGTSAGLSPEGKILFIEEVGEYYYHIDRMIISLKLAGKLNGLSALIIGGMSKLEEAKVPWGRTIEETISDLVKEYDYPVFFNFPAGHVPDNCAFYIGKNAKISVKGSKTILEYT
jgi:muramoyltetrapeptide carboxypeptidase